ncbi:hypothetical protein FHW69_002977 [Luteibacter sp. Sphag1AF]|nr:hypothetical protein [Luteibacter sp. Sphag1AF]
MGGGPGSGPTRRGGGVFFKDRCSGRKRRCTRGRQAAVAATEHGENSRFSVLSSISPVAFAQAAADRSRAWRAAVDRRSKHVLTARQEASVRAMYVVRPPGLSGYVPRCFLLHEFRSRSMPGLGDGYIQTSLKNVAELFFLMSRCSETQRLQSSLVRKKKKPPCVAAGWLVSLAECAPKRRLPFTQT